MSSHAEVIDRLKEANRLERELAEMYKHTGDRADDEHIQRVLHGIAERHASHSERLTVLNDRLEREAGEGVFGELMESIGEALGGMISTIPVMIVGAGTDITYDTLGRYEGTLVGIYQAVEPVLDDEARQTITALADDCRNHMERLTEIDPLA